MQNNLLTLALLLAFPLALRAANLMHGDYDTDAERVSRNWENRELRRMHWKYNPRQRLTHQQLLSFSDPIKRAQHSHPDEPILMKQDRRGKWKDVYELNGEYVQRRINVKKEHYKKRKAEYSAQDPNANGLTRSAVYKKRQKEIAREGNPDDIMPFRNSRKGRETMTKGQYLEMLRTYDRGWKKKNMQTTTSAPIGRAEPRGGHESQTPANGAHPPSTANSREMRSSPRHDSPRQSSPSTPFHVPLSEHGALPSAQHLPNSPRALSPSTPSTPSSSAMSNFIKNIDAVENRSHSHSSRPTAPAQSPSRSGSLSPTSKFLKDVTNGLF